jgi:RNA polymerase sigma-70 factor, ECF subfamily
VTEPSAGGAEHRTWGRGPEPGSECAPGPGIALDWEVAYRENLGWVYHFVYGRVGNRPDAEDLTAEVFTRALPRLKLAAAPEQRRAYLATTARRLLADYWRRHYDLDLPLAVEGGPAPPTPAAVSGDENAQRANHLLALLPDHYRRVLELRFLQGYSVRETARTLSISVASAKVLQHRALRLAAELGRQELT